MNKPILKQIQELQELLVLEKMKPITRTVDRMDVLEYRLYRIEVFLYEQFDFFIEKKIPEHRRKRIHENRI